MNKICIIGWVYNIQEKTLDNGGASATFVVKTRKLVGKTRGYDYIPCDVRGKKGKTVVNNLNDGAKVQIWGRLNLKNDEDINTLLESIAVDEIEFLDSYYK